MPRRRPVTTSDVEKCRRYLKEVEADGKLTQEELAAVQIAVLRASGTQ